jgi:hypothetical protein
MRSGGTGHDLLAALGRPFHHVDCAFAVALVKNVSPTSAGVAEPSGVCAPSGSNRSRAETDGRAGFIAEPGGCGGWPPGPIGCPVTEVVQAAGTAAMPSNAAAARLLCRRIMSW